jgi:hypothetical protein
MIQSLASVLSLLLPIMQLYQQPSPSMIEIYGCHRKPSRVLVETTIPKMREKVYLDKALVLSNSDMESAKINKEDNGSNGWWPSLSITFPKEGAKR